MTAATHRDEDGTTGAMFYDPRKFGFCEALERDWEAIRSEYRGVRDRLAPWHERKLYEGDAWQVFPLFGFPHGDRIEEAIERCPRTAELIERLVPTHGVAGFSRFAAGARVVPHRGYQGEFLRCHLGLEVPAGDCALRVGGEVRRWAEGRSLVFDDRLEHDAWNLTPHERVVLLIDFVPTF